MFVSMSLPLVIAVATPLISALPVPVPEPDWDSAKSTAIVKSCALGMTLVGSACVAASTLANHPGAQIGGTVLGIAGTAVGAHGIAKEYKDNKKKEDDAAKAAKVTVDQGTGTDNTEETHRQNAEAELQKQEATAPPKADPNKPASKKTPVKELQKQSHKLKGY